MYRYSFVTQWKVNASMQDVWDAIYDTGHWPEWWKGVEEVKEVSTPDAPGLQHITMRSNFEQPVSYNFRVTSIEKFRKIEGAASGEYKGKARWEFEEQNDGAILVKYTWDVTPKTCIKNILSPVSRTLMQWHHDTVMHWGARGLADKLHAGLVEY